MNTAEAIHATHTQLPADQAIKTIIVPLDGSALAEQALPYALLLGNMLHARIELLRVIDSLEPAALGAGQLATWGAVGGGFPAEDSEQNEPRLEEERAIVYLHHQAQLLHTACLKATTTLRIGDAAEIIAECATSNTMIVMATHGYGGLRRLMLGSVADLVVRKATAPVLLIPAGCAVPPEPLLRRILVPLDGSELAQRALPLARELAAISGAELLLVNALVIPPAPIGISAAASKSAFGAYDSMLHGLNEQATHNLNAAAERIHNTGTQVGTRVIPGDPAHVIAETALQEHADMVVMATHGYGGVRRWALGSVADYVLHHVHTPLLLVHEK